MGGSSLSSALSPYLRYIRDDLGKEFFDDLKISNFKENRNSFQLEHLSGQIDFANLVD